MSSQVLKVPTPTNVCIFCATRLQLPTIHAATRNQRRLFRTTATKRKPPSGARGQEIDHEQEQWPENGWQHPPKSRPRWEGAANRPLQRGSDSGQSKASDHFSRRQEPQRQSTGSELASLLDGLSKSVSSTQSTNYERAPVDRSSTQTNPPSSRLKPYSTTPARRLGGEWTCGCGHENSRTTQMCRSCHAFRLSYTSNEARRTWQSDWTCKKCNTLNDGSQETCQSCSPRPRRAKSRSPRDEIRGRDESASRRMSFPPTSQLPHRPNFPRDQSKDAGEDSSHFARGVDEERRIRESSLPGGTFGGPRRSLGGDANPNPAWAQSRGPLSSIGGQSQSEKTPPATAFPDDQDLETDPRIFFDDSFADEAAPQTAQNQAFMMHQKQKPERDFARQRKIKRGGVLRNAEWDAGEAEGDSSRSKRKAERLEQRKRAKAAQIQAGPPKPVYIPEFISVSNLAPLLKVRVDGFLRKMKELGFDELNHDHILDAETASLIAAEFHFEAVLDQPEDQDLKPLPPVEDQSVLPARPPVVTIMGHVDHGKTTLLDYLRKSSVAASEHGGITQHIGAFSVRMPGGRLVTFLDTPGHEAFLAMRKRGANVTDIVILVVAADDSVMPQTIEAIKHAQSARVPMIVAINKVDKEDSNIERVKSDLARHGVEIEDFGGDTQTVPVSGKTGEGIEELEEATVALADLLDRRAETEGQVEGWVLEGTTKRAGRTATVLVRRGQLRPNDIIVAGTSWARVRCLRNEAGVIIESAGPGTPIEVDGWREQPTAGDEMIQAPDEAKAKSVIDYRLELATRQQSATDIAAINESRRLEQEKREDLKKAEELAKSKSSDSTPIDTGAEATHKATTPAAPKLQQINFILKADVSGSLEAVTNYISGVGNSEVRPHVLRGAVGPISEFDIDHAAAASGSIISFNTQIDNAIRHTAEARGVRIIDHSIIYRLVDEVKAVLSEKLAPLVTQKVIGEAEIAQVFDINVKGRKYEPVAGCKVRNGVVGKGRKIRVLRNKDVIYHGQLSSLKSVKKDVDEMRKGTECGMSFTNWAGFRVGDQVQSYDEIVEKRTL